MLKLKTRPIELWEHQKILREQMDRATQNSTVCAPTGTGKSRVISSYVIDQILAEKYVAVIVPKVELIDNIAESIAAFCPDIIRFFYTPCCSKKNYIPGKRLIVATYGSFMNKYVKMRVKPSIFIHDESHHCMAETWRKIVKLPGIHFGFTATPLRLDNKSLSGDFPGFIETGRSVEWFIDNKFLCPLDIKTTFKVNFDPTKGYDDLSFQASILDNKKITGDAVAEWRKYADGLRTVCFTTTKEHSRHVLEAYQRDGVTAIIVDGDMSPSTRKEALQGHKEGRYTILINVGIVIEGVDLPLTVCCQMLRFTQSVAFFQQCVGRVMRYVLDKRGILLDHAGNVAYHQTPTALIDWRSIYYGQLSLDEARNPPKPVACTICDYVFFTSASKVPWDHSGGEVCPDCGTFNVIKLPTRRSEKEIDITKGLEDFDATPTQQAILKIAGGDIVHQRKITDILKLVHISGAQIDQIKLALYAIQSANTDEKRLLIDQRIEHELEHKELIKPSRFQRKSAFGGSIVVGDF